MIGNVIGGMTCLIVAGNSFFRLKKKNDLGAKFDMQLALALALCFFVRIVQEYREEERLNAQQIIRQEITKRFLKPLQSMQMRE